MASITKGKQQLRMDGKVMTLTFFKFYNLFKQRYISSVKSHKILIKLISLVQKDSNGLNFLKNDMYICTVPLIKL